ncbi:MAG TPA: hypothetical protein VGB63_06645 [Pedobacter sp.]|jgi:hypothetical protein
MKSKTLIVASIAALSLFACKKERILNNEIYGKWFQERIHDKHISREDYNFTRDGKVEIVRSLLDKSSKNLKGYYSKEIASFSVEADSIILKNIENYWSGGDGVKPLNELTYSSTSSRMAYKAVYSEDKAQVTLLFYCPLSASCIPYPKLTRVR